MRDDPEFDSEHAEWAANQAKRNSGGRHHVHHRKSSSDDDSPKRGGKSAHDQEVDGYRDSWADPI